MATETDRRGFFVTIIKASSAIIGAATVIPGMGLLMAPILNRSQRKQARLVFASPQDSQSTTFVSARLEGQEATAAGVFYKRGADGSPIVLSAVCTHAGCAVTWKQSQGKFYCPCHQGYFDANGKNIAGPPPRPLTRLTAVVKGGDIFVDEVEA